MKKLFGILIVAICSFGLMAETNMDLDNTELLSFLSIQEAEACTSTPINNGRCSANNNCFVDPGNPMNNCDSTKGGGTGPTTPPPGGGYTGN